MAKDIDAKYLEGLSFSSSKPVKVKKDGVEKTEFQRFTRDLTADDVLDWKDGDPVVIVTKDGKKYNVAKKAKK